MKELGSATGVIFPVALQCSIVHGPIPAFEVREQTSRRSASPPAGRRSSGGGDSGGHEHVEPAGPLPTFDLPNCSLHIDNLNTEHVQFKSLICDPSSSFSCWVAAALLLWRHLDFMVFCMRVSVAMPVELLLFIISFMVIAIVMQ
ncbi:uncharacterized protein LACBIDRAFT_318476 [Laccaria bicolor S238N-H82]|uniref:Predicted protein n=1 Tax=Laccaria bicolor (strain S238N-H82 / ATCC MYA-4686) TaxID=486041 RepID=B0E2I9_LACBS|nr:uncharacterized protein LACBIDRAFT_318476 [Laccaria bicolor S238N-H82]EDQ98956.1 predicted protein [Laccaria bicolor S238N-H82]|eukprot:XP_001890407.1 predicted protein [Laccaria bicolor S238N-H82]